MQREYYEDLKNEYTEKNNGTAEQKAGTDQ